MTKTNAGIPSLEFGPTRGCLGAPDVTFIVAANNVADFIVDAVRSALSQRDADVEVVVVDDKSDDNTAALVERIAIEDARVRLIRSDNQIGPAAARNLAIEVARGRWLAVLDGDDFMEPSRTRRLVELAEATSADIVADNFERVAIDGTPTGKTMFPFRPPAYAFSVDAATFISGNNIMGGSRLSLGAIKPMLSAEFVRTNKLRFDEELQIGEDFHLLLEALLCGARFHVLSEPLYKYRIRPGSQSWRLKPGHPERLVEAYNQTRVNERGNAEAQESGEIYLASLQHARQLLQVVDRAERGEIAGALSLSARHPAIWTYLVKSAFAALSRRLYHSKVGREKS